MNLLKSTFRKFATFTIILVQIINFSTVAFPQRTFAQEAPPECPPVASGIKAPTGAAAHTFTFRPAGSPAPECVWENAYYIWSPYTRVYTPKYDTHVCDAATGVCETVEWVFVPPDNQYVERRTTIAPPAPAAPEASVGSQTTAGVAPTATQNASSTVSAGSGNNSNSTIANNTNTNINDTIVNNTSVLLGLNSNANSGNATALSNGVVGNVSSGDAAAIANILNMIQSTWDPSQGSLTLFSADLLADHYGDLLFDPSIVLGSGNDSDNSIANNANQAITLNVTDNASIQNDINLNTNSGNATARGNGSAGNVSTGDAHAVANVINMINSMIQAGESFIGSINIHGDLDGDILLPQSIMDILLGDGSGSSNAITTSSNTTIDENVDSNYSITNNTNLQATSGNTNVTGNGDVGSVLSGNAETNVNQMNLIGQNVQNSHGLLVFVNVLGSWVGMLFGGPGNAAISAGNGSGSSNTIANNANTDIALNHERNYDITNNLNLTAASGNATATGNGTVGNVSTGNATASANILNMINSTMNFTDWFGVLFINVFGNWNGSFGVDTESGEHPAGGQGGGSPAPVVSRAGSGSVAGAVSTNIRQTVGTILGSQSSGTDQQPTAPSQATSSTNIERPIVDITPSTAAVAASGNVSVWWITGVAGLISLLLLGGERLLLLIRKP